MNAMSRRERGLSLVELMVALAIGLFLLAGAVSVFAKTRDLYRSNELASRLQENARFAMSMLEADLRMASYWGLINNAIDIRNAPANPGDVPTGMDAALQGALNACGPSWAVDVERYLEAADADYPLACDPESDVVAGSDLLTIRHAQAAVIANLAGSGGQVKIAASRSGGELFTDTTSPINFAPPLAEPRAVVVHSYYVAQESDTRAATPSLRRKRLGFAGGAPTVEDDEIIPGIEDLQLQIGWDVNGDQNADFYTDPAEPGVGVPANAAAVSVRAWLMVRSETPEIGFVDDRTYNYANRLNYAPADNLRRLLVSKTIMLRNTRR